MQIKYRHSYNTLAEQLPGVLQPWLLLFFRLSVAWVFLRSGWLKFNSWDSTLYLFEYEYQVPLISPIVAAYMGTAAELILPVLLILGLCTRLTALALFVFNIVAVISYPVLTSAGFVLFTKGALDHQLWGVMLLMLVFAGGGKLSADRRVGLS